MSDLVCIYPECPRTDRHWHGKLPGAFVNPDDPDGPPIGFTSEPPPGVRGALLASDAELAAEYGRHEP